VLGSTDNRQALATLECSWQALKRLQPRAWIWFTNVYHDSNLYICYLYIVNIEICVCVCNQCQFGCLFKQRCEKHKHLLLLLASIASVQDDKHVLQIATDGVCNHCRRGQSDLYIFFFPIELMKPEAHRVQTIWTYDMYVIQYIIYRKEKWCILMHL
jgi:hypothetical protein